MDAIRDDSAEKMRDLAQDAAEAAKRLREKGVDVNTSAKGSKTASTDSSRQSGQGSSREEQGRAGSEDDDIVARQLREAAENETDPELKEKLWKEYDEYKKN